MGLDRSGRPQHVPSRTDVTSSDTAKPSGASVGVAVPDKSRGSITHVLVQFTAGDTAGAVVVTVYGYSIPRATWYALGRLNGGSTITRPTHTPTGVADNNAE